MRQDERNLHEARQKLAHDTSPAARAADDERLALQLRVVPLLDRRIEGVHIDMDDLARHEAKGLGMAVFEVKGASIRCRTIQEHLGRFNGKPRR